MKHLLLVLSFNMLLLGLAGCKTDYAELPTYSNTRQLQAVIEVPAGTNQQIKYDRKDKEFVNEKEAGLDKRLKFLPYPGNYGFIPSTEIEQNGRGLGVFVIAESVPTGIVMDVIPVATLLLKDIKGDVEVVIMAVPARPSEQIISATDFTSLNQHYSAVKEIIEKWFMHRNSNAQTTLVGWRDEQFAEKEVQRWMDL